MITAGTLISAVMDECLKTQLFLAVNGVEPKSAPPDTGLTASVWVQSLQPIQLQSGLNTTSMLFTVSVRLYGSMLAEPQEAIDPAIMAAVDTLMEAYTGNFSLGGLVESIDLLGRHSEGLRGDAGYVSINNKMFRVFTITVPMVVNDVYVQVR
jgi:hypothetical protein